MLRLIFIASLFLSLMASEILSQNNTIPDIMSPDYSESKQTDKIPTDLIHSCKSMYNNRILNNADGESAIVWRPYNVLNYDVFLNWYGILSREEVITIDSVEFGKKWLYDTTRYYDRSWNGINRIKLRIDSAGVDKIVLDAALLIIDSVKSNGQTLEFNQEETLLNIFPGDLNEGPGSVIDLEIYYRYNYTENWGFWFFDKGYYVGLDKNNDSVIVEEKLAYTMSEPQAARYWMPCNDWPHDKAVPSITVRVPAGFSVASNGHVDKIVKDDSSWTYYWSDYEPISTYLMVATVSKYKEFSDYYTRQSDTNSKIELKYYVWQKDFDQKEPDRIHYAAEYTFRNMKDIMRVFCETLGEYHWDKYGQAAVQPFSFGGMEHTTMTTINRVWMRTDAQSGIAHELAHQWLGDKVTCATWNDIWINEGGATWCESLWFEHRTNGSMNSYNYDMYVNKRAYLNQGGMTLPPIYGLPIDKIFGRYAVLVYQKAGWVYHMLSTMLGEDVFLQALQKMMERHAFEAIETKDFQKSLETDIPDPPVPFDVFFDQWLYHAGHPVYALNTTPQIDWQNSGYNAEVEVVQLQDTSSVKNVFVVPLTLEIYSGGKSEPERFKFINNERVQKVTFHLDARPDSVFIDTTEVLLQVQSSVVSVEDNIKPEPEINIYPNPVSSVSTGTLEFNNPVSGEVSIEIFDINSRKVGTIFNDYLPVGNFKFDINMTNEPSGIYFVKISGRTNTFTRKFSFVN